MLEIREFSVNVGSFSLKDVSLKVEDDEYHVIVGPTGSGKTLLLEIILGFRRAQRGGIWLDARDITDEPTERRQISYLPQDLALFPHLSVKDNIFYGLNIKKTSDRHELDMIDDLIKILKIDHLLNRSIHNLSGGERQRVALVRAIAPGYKYLILDEPFSALHEGLKRELWFLIKDLQKRYRLTILMVSHDMEETFFLADTISIIIDGRIHQTGRKSEVFRKPVDIEVAKFFGIRNLFEAEVIDIQDEILSIHCPEVNTYLTVLKDALPLDKNLKVKDRLVVGIRPEDVMILRKDLMKQDQDNLLKGVIHEIFHKGTTHTVLFQPKDSLRLIEIDLPDYAFQKLSLLKRQEVVISLRKENIFLIPEIHRLCL